VSFVGEEGLSGQLGTNRESIGSFSKLGPRPIISNIYAKSIKVEFTVVDQPQLRI
jgi:hypothetical protein